MYDSKMTYVTTGLLDTCNTTLGKTEREAITPLGKKNAGIFFGARTM